MWVEGSKIKTKLPIERNLVFTVTETGNRKPETGNRKSETGNRKPETGNRKSEIGNRKPEIRNPKPHIECLFRFYSILFCL